MGIFIKIKYNKTCCIFIAFLVQIFATSSVYCQIEQQLDSLKIQYKSIQIQLKEINNILKEDTASSDIVGQFYLTNTVKLRTERNTQTDVKIKSVEISILGGTIYSIRVKSEDNKVFYEGGIRVPIKYLIEKNNTSRDSIKIKQIDIPGNFLYITEVLRYEPSIGNPFLPEDGDISLTPRNSIKKVEIGTDINSYIEFKVYTDLLALLNNEPNGLIQSELSTKINLFDYPKCKTFSGFLFYFLHYIEPSVRLRKFDSTNENVSLAKEANIKSISNQSYYDLLQRSYLDGRIDWSVFYLKDGDQSFDFRLGVGYSLSNVLLPDSSVVDGSFISYRLGLKSQTLKYKNFGLTTLLNYHVILPQKVVEFGISSKMKIAEISAEIFFHPLGNQKNKLYARFALNEAIGKKEIVREQPFLQIGYQTKLGFKSKK